MERLTVPAERLPDGTTRMKIIDSRKVKEHAMEFYWRLKKYEDTGYTPEDFDRLCREMSDLRMLAGIDTYDNLRDTIRSGKIRVIRDEGFLLARDKGEKPKTNADRIRAMNNYELAVFLAKIKGDLEYDDRWVVAYSTQDMVDNLNWLCRPLQHTADDEDKQHSGLVED